MSTRYKDFGSGGASDAAPLSFRLHDEEFHCVKAVQGKVMLDMVKESSSEDPAKNAEMIEKFFSQVLMDESYERFQALLVHKDKIVTVDALAEITGWLIEEYTERPLEQPEIS